MLRFRLHQLVVPSLGKHLILLPKLNARQLSVVASHLEARRFAIRPGSAPGKLIAQRGAIRISIDGSLGLASSGDDILDAIAPAIPGVLASGRQGTTRSREDMGPFYFSLKRSGTAVELQLFPRVESLRTWTCLRTDGLCGLSPDEAFVLRRLLGNASSSAQIECVTSSPVEGSVALQAGRNLYYRSKIPVAEFLSCLRTVDSEPRGQASYLPRDSVVKLAGVRVDTSLMAAELGEWCFVQLEHRRQVSLPNSLNDRTHK